VLVVEDLSRSRRSLVSTLASHGFRAVRTGTKTSALTRAIGYEPDFVLLDVQDVGNAVEVAARLRDLTAAPILVLLPKESAGDGGTLLDAGASDYLVRPFRPSHLVARMRVWLRQSARERGKAPDTDRFRIDAERRTLIVEGREVHLTPLECKLLFALARSPGKALTPEQLLAAVWGAKGPSRGPYLRAHLRQLRQKIEGDPDRPRYLVTAPGGGYLLKPG
jgi:two-component system KDP operon response regulator KdpE